MDLAHILLITVHATAAVLAFVFGLVVFIRLPVSPRAGAFVAYAICLWVAVVGLIVVVIVDGARLDLARRIAFPLLGVLGLYMLLRTEQARRTIRAQRPGWRQAFIGHVGFVLISLFDGFCIVLAIDLHMPIWVVVAAAVLGVAVGIVAIRMRSRGERDLEARRATT
jgi:hypothetical protein